MCILMAFYLYFFHFKHICLDWLVPFKISIIHYFYDLETWITHKAREFLYSASLIFRPYALPYKIWDKNDSSKNLYEHDLF